MKNTDSFNSNVDELELLDKLKKCWSVKSSSLWTKENPSKGQCGVTSIVVHELFGGMIMKTLLASGQQHFYNFINGKRIDFTKDQFSEPIIYNDIPSSREEAFLDTNNEQYNFLLTAFKKELLKD
jgi:hypothetical protein